MAQKPANPRCPTCSRGGWGSEIETITPAQVIFQALERHGYVSTRAGFAELVKVNPKNAWAYLLDDGDERRIRPRPQTLHRWASAIAERTWLQVSIVMPPLAAVHVHVQGRDSAGNAITAYALATTLQAPEKNIRRIKRKHRTNIEVDRVNR